HGVGCRRNLLPPVEKAPSKPFKAYAPGFLHRDVTRRATKLTRRATKLTYLPRRQDGTSRRDLFVAIDRATRWLFIAVKPNKTAASAPAFLKALHKACPIKISKRLTDNGKDKVAGSDFGPPRGSRRDEPLGGDEPCTDRPFGNRARAPAGQHEFDQLGHALGMEHRLTPPRSPTPLPGAKGDPPSAGPPGEPQGRGGQTQGMVERFNGRIADILKTHPFDSALNLEQTLHRDVTLYNYHLPQSALGSQTPIQGMKAGYTTHPNLFHRRIYDRPGLDT
ncbi:integrase core domain-containing protein, partial [Methylococcus sp. BF19-07]